MPFQEDLEPFATAIVDDYYNARLPISGDAVAGLLTRGTLRVTSSLAEERVAEWILRNYRNVEHIYIDQRMSNHATPVRKPDLAIVVEGEVRLLVDVKMDLNWKREMLPSFVRDAREWLDGVIARGEPLNIKARISENAREPRQLTISPRCQTLILVLAGDPAEMREGRSSARTMWHGRYHPNHATNTRAETVASLVANVNKATVEALQKICDDTLLASEPATP